MRRRPSPLVLVACLLASTPALALDAKQLEYLVELGHGIAIPIGGDGYTRLADPSYKAQLRFAVDIPIIAGMRLGPCVQLDGSPVNTDDTSFENVGLDARFGRVRFLVGADLRYRVIERLDVFVRFGIGVDHVGGTVRVKALGNLQVDYGSTVVAFEPAVGLNVRVWRNLMLGASFSFPFGVNHSFAGINQFNAADVDLSVLGGWRF